MAKKSSRPGRTLIVFFLGLAIAYALVAIGGTWKPQLGLDLAGGTRITLIAKGDTSGENLDQAKDIIDQRVNGSGVSEAAVTVEGKNIQVEIPGKQDSDLVQIVERQASLRFRLVACDGTAACGSAPTSTTPPTTTAPTAPPSATSPGTGTGTAKPGSSATAKPSQGATSGAANRAPSYLRAGPGSKPTTKPTTTPTRKPTSTPSSTPTSTPSGTPTSTPTQAPEEPSFDESYIADYKSQLAFQTSPDAAAVAEYNQYTCDAKGDLLDAKTGQPANLPDDPTKPLVACGGPTSDTPGAEYLLSKAVIEGQDVTDAQAQIPQNSVAWAVGIDLNGRGSGVQTKLSQAIAGDTTKNFAIVLDGQVISKAYYESVITGGSSQITGSFTQDQADTIATSLRYGALPISFDKKETSFETIGPSLAGDQLRAGLTAGAIGLLLVMLYCLLYYRGLGVVVLSSLVVAAGLTFAMVLLLSKTAGFTLTLPGIAGLIIAIGVTADSFIIFFERIRDEMRDGKSMRVAVESGWIRARNTTLAADGVQLLAAVVLYIFAAGVVKGFAFALGLSTIIDLVVFFFFTKPLITQLAHYRFFSKGHRLSGLSRATLGIDGPASPAGGRV